MAQTSSHRLGADNWPIPPYSLDCSCGRFVYVPCHTARIEFGSDWSTAWLATRCEKLFSLEYDPAWYAQIKVALDARRLDNCLLLMVGRDDFATTITAFRDESSDLALVDGRDERAGCVESAARKLRRGGLLVLDESDHRAYRPVDRALDSWPRRVFIGLKPYPLTASETAIYRRP
jgi:hypothetical protein